MSKFLKVLCRSTELPRRTERQRKNARTLLTLVATVLLVVSGCSGGETSEDVETAEALIDAVFAADEEAIDLLPWAYQQGTNTKPDAVRLALSVEALNPEVLEAPCEHDNSRPVVTCYVVMTSDLVHSLGLDSMEATADVRFNAEGQITSFAYTADETLDAFERWAFSTYPSICDPPAECPVTLLDLVDEYLGT